MHSTVCGKSGVSSRATVMDAEHFSGGTARFLDDRAVYFFSVYPLPTMHASRISHDALSFQEHSL